MSHALAALLRKSTATYRNLWMAQAQKSFATQPNDEVVVQHHGYWDAIARAVDTGEFDELTMLARQAGEGQFASGLDVASAVARTVEATNLIEIALLETNDGEMSQLDVVSEIADVRSMLVMAVVSGYNAALAREERAEPVVASAQLRSALLQNPEKYKKVQLKQRDEIGPLYDEEMRFYAIVSGKIRVYNLLPTGRTITVSILSEEDVFLQWRARASSLACVCAEAMQASEVISVSQKDLVDVLAAQPAAALDVISSFAQRLTESSVLIKDLMDNSINLRLYRTLLELADQFGQNTVGKNAVLIDVPLTHQRLADMVGSNRVTVTRKLLELQKRGLIAGRGTGSIEILDLEALQRLMASA